MQNIIYAVIGVLFSVMAMYQVAPSVDKYIQANKVESLIEKEKQIYDATKRYITNTGSIPSDIDALVTAGYLTSDVATDNGWGQPITLTTTSTQANGQIIINTNIPNAYAKEVYLRSFKKSFTATNASGDDIVSNFVLPIDVLHGNSGGVLSGAVASATAPTEPLTKYWYDTSDTSKGAILKVKDEASGTWVAIAGGSMLPKVSSTNTVTATASLPTSGVTDGDIRYVYNSGTSAVDTYVYYGTGWQKYLSGGTTTTSTCYGQYYTCTNITTYGLVAYYPLTGTADDWKNTYHGTESGAMLYTNDITKGAIVSFDGSNDYISTNLNIANTAITFSFWINTDGTDISYILGNSSGSTVKGLMAHSSSGKMSFYMPNGSGGYYSTVTMDTAIPLNRNVYYTLSWDGLNNSDSVKIFEDGVLKKQGNSGTTLSATYARNLYIASENDTGGNYYSKFNLSNVRVYNRVLSASEITTIYNEESKAHPIAVDSGLIAYYPLKRNSHDNYYNQYNGTDTATPTYDGKSVSLNGSSQYIQTSQRIPTPNNQLAVSIWAKFSDTANRWLINQRSNASGGSEWQIAYHTNNLFVSVLDSSNNSYGVNYGAISTGVWYNIVLVYSGSKVYMYVDGSLVGSASAPSTIPTTSAFMTIGKNGWDNSFYMKGNLGDARIYNRSLTATEITQIYNTEKKDFQ